MDLPRCPMNMVALKRRRSSRQSDAIVRVCAAETACQNHRMADAPRALLTLLAAVRARSTGIGSHIHGELHWRTVGANGLWLAEPLDGADTHVIFLFALLHDSMRESDGRDPQHGPRAAALAGALHAEGVMPATADQVETLQ